MDWSGSYERILSPNGPFHLKLFGFTDFDEASRGLD